MPNDVVSYRMGACIDFSAGSRFILSGTGKYTETLSLCDKCLALRPESVYDLSFKQRVVEYFLWNQPNISFRSIANLFQIQSDHVTVKRLSDRYDGTIPSLQHHHRSGKPSILNKKQVNQFITKVIHSHNRVSRPVLPAEQSGVEIAVLREVENFV